MGTRSSDLRRLCSVLKPSRCLSRSWTMVHRSDKRINVFNAQITTRYSRQVDVLQEHLTRARASGGVFARSVARPPWGLCLPGTIQLAVHAVLVGEAWLWLDDRQTACKLTPGDVALVRGGVDHSVAHSPTALCQTGEDFRAQHSDDEHANDPEATVFLCGAYQFRRRRRQPTGRSAPTHAPLATR